MTVVLGYDESPGADGALRVAIEVSAAFDEPLVLVYGVAVPGGTGEEYADPPRGAPPARTPRPRTRGRGGRRGRRRDHRRDHRREAGPGPARRRRPPRGPAHRRGHLGREPDARRPAGLDPAQAAADQHPSGPLRAFRAALIVGDGTDALRPSAERMVRIRIQRGTRESPARNATSTTRSCGSTRCTTRARAGIANRRRRKRRWSDAGRADGWRAARLGTTDCVRSSRRRDSTCGWAPRCGRSNL